ncbi:MAG: M1 family metallopeptidase [Polyangiales bacterium]
MIVSVLAGCLALTPARAAPASVPKGKLDGAVVPVAYRLDLTIVPERARFSGHAEIDVTLKGGERSIVLHGRDLKVAKVQVRQGADGVPATYRQVDASGVAQVTVAKPLRAGPATLVFEYDAPFAQGTAGLYHLKVGAEHYAWSQLEAVDARGVFPSFDEPGYKTPYTVSITTAPNVVAVTNEAETGQTPAGALVRHAYATTAPLPTYLITFAVGPFDVVESTVPPTPQRARPLPLRILATKGQKDKLAYALHETKPIVQLLEKYFDRGFPFSKLDQIASPMMGGAMENAGAVVYDDTLLVLDEGAPVRQKQAFGMVVAHELAHQWFGDLVTPAWWDDIWLNESFANWLGFRIANEWKPDLNIGLGALEEALNAMNVDALKVGRPIRQPITRTGDIDSAFDAITYGKGGQVIAMVESFLGAEKFRAGVRLHMQRFANGNATSDDFFRALADGAGEPRLVAAMRSFVDQQGVPTVRVERGPEGLVVSQKRYAPLGISGVPDTRWSIPLCLREGSDKQCTLLEQERATLKTKSKGVLVPNAGGHGYYRFSLRDADWDALIAAAASLTPAEAVATLDSLWAEFRAGSVGMTRIVQAARAFAPSRDSFVATASGDRLSGLRVRGVVSKAALGSYRRLIAEIYAPRLKQLGFDPRTGAHAKDDADTQQLRTDLVGFLAFEAKDADVLARLAQAGGSWLDGDGAAVDRAYLGKSLSAWVERAGLAGAPRIWDKLVASTDAFERGALLAALSRSADPAIARWLLARAGSPDLRVNEKLMLAHGLTSDPATRQLGFDWLAKSFTRLARETNLSSVNMVFSLPGGFCDAAAADRVERALRPQVKAYGRGGLPLDRSVESVRTCAAFVRARGADVETTLRETFHLEGS